MCCTNLGADWYKRRCIEGLGFFDKVLIKHILCILVKTVLHLVPGTVSRRNEWMIENCNIICCRNILWHHFCGLNLWCCICMPVAMGLQRRSHKCPEAAFFALYMYGDVHDTPGIVRRQKALSLWQSPWWSSTIENQRKKRKRGRRRECAHMSVT